ncbi:N-6 DNA methylase [Leptospira weilii]|uniref:N-6 DNA methylase n=1 Tax=Leptospira weilii TaxID=28184 RepID=UPI001E5F8BCF|nr:N-6 DNA methylase [Leptospira weilii]
MSLRKKLLEESEFKVVITLPSGVFKPYIGVSITILIFTKGGKIEHTWFYRRWRMGTVWDSKRTKIDQSDLYGYPWSIPFSRSKRRSNEQKGILRSKIENPGKRT